MYLKLFRRPFLKCDFLVSFHLQRFLFVIISWPMGIFLCMVSTHKTIFHSYTLATKEENWEKGIISFPLVVMLEQITLILCINQYIAKKVRQFVVVILQYKHFAGFKSKISNRFWLSYLNVRVFEWRMAKWKLSLTEIRLGISVPMRHPYRWNIDASELRAEGTIPLRIR